MSTAMPINAGGARSKIRLSTEHVLAAMNQAIMDGIDDGIALLNVISHGNFVQWGLSPGIYHGTDVASQVNGGRQPFVVVENSTLEPPSHFDR